MASELERVFRWVYSPKKEDRDYAESYLTEFSEHETVLEESFQFIETMSEHYEIRRSAAIFVKNIIRRRWKVSLSPASKDVVRNSIVHALLSEDDRVIQNLLGDCVSFIAVDEYPNNWPNIIPDAMSVVNDGENPLRIHNALLIVRKVFKRFEYNPTSLSDKLSEVVVDVFPVLLHGLDVMMSNKQIDTFEGVLMIKLILKIFWSGTQHHMPTCVTVPTSERSEAEQEMVDAINLHGWFFHFSQIISMEVTEDQVSIQLESTRGSKAGKWGRQRDGGGAESRQKSPWWKIKKWATRICCRFFGRYGHPRYVEEELVWFAGLFNTTMAPMILESILTLLFRFSKGEFCPDVVLHSSLMFLETACELSSTYCLLQPHVEPIITQICYPLLHLTPADVDNFESDPVEFIRNSYDIESDFLSPMWAAKNLINGLVKYRTPHVLPQVLSYIASELAIYNQTDPADRDYLHKDGLLNMICAISDVLKDKKSYVRHIEPMIMEHVLQEFDNDAAPFVKCRACRVIADFFDVTFKDPNNIQIITMGCIQLLNDSHIAVQTLAMTAIQNLVQIDETSQLFLDNLSAILEKAFEIVVAADHDAVVLSLQMIIWKFSKQIGPYALALIERFLGVFKTVVEAEDEDQNGDDCDDDLGFNDSGGCGLAASDTLHAICQVMYAVRKTPEIFSKIETLVIPVLLVLLDEENLRLEFIDDSIQMVALLAYYLDAISAEMWPLFHLLYAAFDDQCFDYVNDLVAPFECFMSKDPEYFSTCRHMMIDGRDMSYVDMMLDMARRVIDDDRSAITDVCNCLHVLMAMVNDCAGYVDGALSQVVEITLLCPDKISQRRAFQKANAKLLMSLLYYNPEATLEIIDSHNATAYSFERLFGLLDFFDTEYSTKLVVISLSRIIMIPFSQLPDIVRLNLPQLLTVLSRFSKSLAETRDEIADSDDDDDDDVTDDDGEDDDDDKFGRRRNRRSAGDDEEEDDDDDDEEEFNETEDVYKEEDEAYLQSVRKMSMREKTGHVLQGEPVEEEENQVDERDRRYTSKLDSLNPIEYMVSCLKNALSGESDDVMRAFDSIQQEDANYLKDLLN